MSQFNENDSNYSVYRQDSGQHYYCRWTTHEDALLEKAVKKFGPTKWMLISKYVPGRTAVQCSARWSGALNPNIHKGRWSKQEDQALIDAVKHFQHIVNTRSSSLPWNVIAQHIPYRTGIQCQARWTEALDPSVRKGRWHPKEDEQLHEAVKRSGCCWIRVASMIPTRTQRQCRTRWNQIQSRQLKRNNSGSSSNHAPKTKTISKRTDNEFDQPSVMMMNTYPMNANMFTLDDIFSHQGVKFEPFPENSRMGSISSDPPTPVDLESNQLQTMMALQDPYFASMDTDFMLPIELDSVLNCFALQL